MNTVDDVFITYSELTYHIYISKHSYKKDVTQDLIHFFKIDKKLWEKIKNEVEND